LVRRRRGDGAFLRGRRVGPLAAVGRGAWGAQAIIVRLDLVAGEARAVALPQDLPLTMADGRRVRFDDVLPREGDNAPVDLRDLIGHAVDLDLDAALIVGVGTLASPDASLWLAAATNEASTTIPNDFDAAEIARLHRRFGLVGVRCPPPLDGDPAAFTESIRTTLGLPGRAAAGDEQAAPEVWWP